MLQFIVENFQSIVQAKILVNGFTMLVGESNQGKSACLRALYAATSNRFKTGQVRKGQDYAIIKVKYDDAPDPLVVRRSYSGGSPTVKLGDKIFSKLGRTVPKEMSELNNFGVLKVGEDGYSLNFHEQFQKPLLLEYSQKKVMELLSASQAIDDLNLVKEALAVKRSENRGAFSTVEAILTENNAKLSMLKYDISQLESKMNSIDKLSSEYVSLSETLDDVNAVISDFSILKDLSSKYERLMKISSVLTELLKLDRVSSDIVTVHGYMNEWNTNNAKLGIYQKFVDIYNPQISSDCAKVNDLQCKISVLNDFESEISRKSTILSKLSKVLELHSIVSSIPKVQSEIRSVLSDLGNVDIITKRIVELEDFTVRKICPVCHSKFE